jgi:hypothetical protein
MNEQGAEGATHMPPIFFHIRFGAERPSIRNGIKGPLPLCYLSRSFANERVQSDGAAGRLRPVSMARTRFSRWA